MIAQFENKYISLSVLPVVRVMIPQLENKYISLSVLPVVRVMIAQLEDKYISLSVLPVVRVMIAQLENKYISLSVLPVARVQFQIVSEYFKGFSLADHTLPTRLVPAWQKMALSPLNGTTQPVDIEEEGWSPTMGR